MYFLSCYFSGPSPQTVVFSCKSNLETTFLPLLTCLGQGRHFSTGADPFCFRCLLRITSKTCKFQAAFLSTQQKTTTADLNGRTMGDKLPCHFNQSHPHLSSDLSRVKPFITHQPGVAVFLNLVS